MSNPVHLIATTFEHPAMGTKDHGFILSDNEAKICFDGEESVIMDDMELLQFALKQEGNDIQPMFEFIKEHEKGININNQYYEWEEIKQYFEDYGE